MNPVISYQQTLFEQQQHYQQQQLMLQVQEFKFLQNQQIQQFQSQMNFQIQQQQSMINLHVNQERFQSRSNQQQMQMMQYFYCNRS